MKCILACYDRWYRKDFLQKVQNIFVNVDEVVAVVRD
jgi:hypothetical protein